MEYKFPGFCDVHWEWKMRHGTGAVVGSCGLCGAGSTGRALGLTRVVAEQRRGAGPAWNLGGECETLFLTPPQAPFRGDEQSCA